MDSGLQAWDASRLHLALGLGFSVWGCTPTVRWLVLGVFSRVGVAQVLEASRLMGLGTRIFGFGCNNFGF